MKLIKLLLMGPLLICSGCVSMQYSCFLQDPSKHEHVYSESSEAYDINVELPTGNTNGDKVRRPLVHTVSVAIGNNLDRPAALVFKSVNLEAGGIRKISRYESILPYNSDSFHVRKKYKALKPAEILVISAEINGEKIDEKIKLTRRREKTPQEEERWFSDKASLVQYRSSKGKDLYKESFGPSHVRVSFPHAYIEGDETEESLEFYTDFSVYCQKWFGSEACEINVKRFEIEGAEEIPLETRESYESFEKLMNLAPKGKEGSGASVHQRFIIGPEVKDGTLIVDFEYDGKPVRKKIPLSRLIKREYIDGCIANTRSNG